MKAARIRCCASNASTTILPEGVIATGSAELKPFGTGNSRVPVRACHTTGRLTSLVPATRADWEMVVGRNGNCRIEYRVFRQAFAGALAHSGVTARTEQASATPVRT